MFLELSGGSRPGARARWAAWQFPCELSWALAALGEKVGLPGASSEVEAVFLGRGTAGITACEMLHKPLPIVAVTKAHTHTFPEARHSCCEEAWTGWRSPPVVTRPSWGACLILHAGQS